MPVTASDGRLYYLQMATDSTDIEVSPQIILRVLPCTAGALLLALVAVVFDKVPVQGVIEAWESRMSLSVTPPTRYARPWPSYTTPEMLLETPGEDYRAQRPYNELYGNQPPAQMTSNLLEMVQLQASEMWLRYETVNMKNW